MKGSSSLNTEGGGLGWMRGFGFSLTVLPLPLQVRRGRETAQPGDVQV